MTPLSEAQAALITSEQMYETMVRYVQQRGCRRQELGSGWWWAAVLPSDMGLGEAVETLVSADLDMRDAVPDEIGEFWG